MRTSLSYRSVIAVAVLAIGPVALAATPATAAVPDGVTRDLVLTVTNTLDDYEPGADLTDEQRAPIELLISRSCAFDIRGYSGIDSFDFTPFVNGAADGVLITARLHHEEIEYEIDHTYCTFGAIATADAAFTLSGNFQIGTRPVGDGAGPGRGVGGSLSDNVYVTRSLHSLTEDPADFTASGFATGSVTVTTTDHVSIVKPRTAQGETASKAKYDKRLKAAARWYAKKLKKAGTSKNKKASATKTYIAKKAKYKKAYDKRYPGLKSDAKTTTQTENRPFTITVTLETPPPS